MGIIRNEMTIVHSYSKRDAKMLRRDAVMTFERVIRDKFPYEEIDVSSEMISPIMESSINQEYTFVINGECSKLGWDESYIFHAARMEWAERHKKDAYIVIVNFGEGDDAAKIVFDNTGYKENDE